jgi:hypothetical protein
MTGRAEAQASDVLPTPPLPVKKRNRGGLERKTEVMVVQRPAKVTNPSSTTAPQTPELQQSGGSKTRMFAMSRPHNR